jgi:hypothetical protein
MPADAGCVAKPTEDRIVGLIVRIVGRPIGSVRSIDIVPGRSLSRSLVIGAQRRVSGADLVGAMPESGKADMNVGTPLLEVRPFNSPG